MSPNPNDRLTPDHPAARDESALGAASPFPPPPDDVLDAAVGIEDPRAEGQSPVTDPPPFAGVEALPRSPRPEEDRP